MTFLIYKNKAYDNKSSYTLFYFLTSISRSLSGKAHLTLNFLPFIIF